MNLAEYKRHKYYKYAKTEITENFIYGHFAKKEKKKENSEILERLASQELGHYHFWHSLTPDAPELKPNYFIAYLDFAIRFVFGLTFSSKLLERNEKNAISTYKNILNSIPADKKPALEKIIADEQSHENALINQIKEKRISYIGFIALGLADAIVEITGVHAGFLGITGSTLIAGISGIVVGFSASISMGSAAYIQSKNDTERSPLASGLVTWGSYLGSVILLALPYFLLRSMIPAFVTSTLIGMAMIAIFTFYGAVVFERKFWREFLESASLMLGTAVLTFFFGKIVGSAFKVKSDISS